MTHFSAYFQPIVQLDVREITGYEVLGRLVEGPDRLRSFGAVLAELNLNSRADIAYLIDEDYRIQEEAVRKLKESGKKTKLFLNVMPRVLSSLYADGSLEPDKFHIIQLMHKYEIDPSQLVIEITEDEFYGESSQLLAILDVYRKAGIQIALDDVGAGMNDLNRVAMLRPDLIKIDLALLRRSMNDMVFRQVLHAVSMVAQKMNASLVFEGIEKEEELYMALRMGAEYVQGFLFSEAKAQFQNKAQFTAYLDDILKNHLQYLVAETMYNYECRDSLLKMIESRFASMQSESSEDAEVFAKRVKELPISVHTATLYDSTGRQISGTYHRNDAQDWAIDESKVNANISWQPFFLQALATQEYYGSSTHASEPYHDLKSPMPQIRISHLLKSGQVVILEADWFA